MRAHGIRRLGRKKWRRDRWPHIGTRDRTCYHAAWRARAFHGGVGRDDPVVQITVTPGDTLKRAMSLMTNHRVRHLIVIANGSNSSASSAPVDVVKYRLEDLEADIECPTGRLHSGALRCNVIPSAGRPDVVRGQQ